MGDINYSDLVETGVLVAGQYDKQGKVIVKPIIAGSEEEKESLNRKYEQHMRSQDGSFIPSTVVSAVNSTSTVQNITDRVVTPVKRGRKPKPKAIIVPSNLPSVSLDNIIDVDTNVKYRHSKDTLTQEIVEQKVEARGEPVHPVEVFEEEKVIQKRITFENNFGKIRLEVEDILYQDNLLGIMLVFSNDNKLTFIPKVGETLNFTDDNKNEHKVYFPGSLFDYHGKIVMILFNVPDNIDVTQENLTEPKDNE